MSGTNPSDEAVLLERRNGAVAILTLNEPAKRNALTPTIRVALAEAVDRIERDPAIRAVVITGSPQVFSAGGDLTAMQADGLAGGRDRFRLLHSIVRSIVKSSKPYIAAVEGWAAGPASASRSCATRSSPARARASSPRSRKSGWWPMRPAPHSTGAGRPGPRPPDPSPGNPHWSPGRPRDRPRRRGRTGRHRPRSGGRARPYL